MQELLRIHAEADIEGPPVCGDIESSGYWREGISQMPGSTMAMLLGDFNFRPDSSEYEKIVGPMSPYGGRVTHPLGFVDAWVFTGGDEKMGNTGTVGGVRTRLDYAFVSASLAGRIQSCWVDVAANGSDHQPVWVQLS